MIVELALLALVPLPIVTASSPAIPAAVKGVEISFVTRAGEGSTGRKRFRRDGCYQTETEGSNGAEHVRDSQAGCHRASDVAATFERLDALVAAGRAVTAVGDDGGDDGARDRFRDVAVTLIGSDGTRWRGADADVARAIAGAVDELPSENQWYAPAPDRPAGKGAQVLVLSAGRQGRHLEASLTADGRWWCYRSAPSQGTAIGFPPAKVRHLFPGDATARLGRILAGVPAKAVGEPTAASTDGGREISVEVIWLGRERAPVGPKPLAAAVADRFADEMRAQASACALP